MKDIRSANNEQEATTRSMYLWRIACVKCSFTWNDDMIVQEKLNYAYKFGTSKDYVWLRLWLCLTSTEETKVLKKNLGGAEGSIEGVPPEKSNLLK